MDVPVRCQCGQFEAKLVHADGSSVKRFVCMCDDCQAYAYHLGQVEATLDDNGGTEVIPVAPGNLKITKGFENLKCLRFSPQGLHRFYAGCCNSPIANAVSLKMAYIGLVANTIDLPTREKLFGPIHSRIMSKFGMPPFPSNTHEKAPLSLIFIAMKNVALTYLKKLNRPSPFFNNETGEPVVEPYLFSKEERQKLKAQFM